MRILKWRKPKDKIEEYERLTIIEDRGDRVLVTSNYSESSLGIISTACYSKSELIDA